MKLTSKGKTTVERVAELAMRLGGKPLADYGSARRRHDFTQRQLLACLIRRAYLKTTYRGVLELLSVSPNLRAALGMQDKLPHYTTLQKFSARSRVLAIADAMIRTIGRAAGEPQFAKTAAAMDATGLEPTTASAHFQSRSGRTRRQWVKVSTIVLCGSLLPLSLVLGWGPGNDKSQAKELMTKAGQATLPAKLYADAGYDAEWVHDQCRLDWGAESVIKPARQRADERAISGTERLWHALGGGILFQRVETDDGFNPDLPQTEPTAGRSRLQGPGLHPPAVAGTMRPTMFSTEQKHTSIGNPVLQHFCVEQLS
jgi:hypothetical protein